MCSFILTYKRIQWLFQGRDIAAISPTGTGKTLAYLLPLFARLGSPAAKSNIPEQGVRALILAPTRELAAQIYNETLKLALGRKWRVVLFSKATASTLKDPAVRSKVGMCGKVYYAFLMVHLDIIISTPLRLVASIQSEELLLNKYVPPSTAFCFSFAVVFNSWFSTKLIGYWTPSLWPK